MITTTAALSTVVERFSKAEFVTVDTEFMRETTFWPQLCLIQIAVPGEHALVDPLAPGIDLAPFFALMANEAVLKVFHAARQDIEIMVHRGNLVPAPIFDTQIAAMVCGFGEQVGYEALVARLTGGRIDKSSRFTDWSARPLSLSQLAYAADDVTHLCDVYLKLKAKLDAEGRTEWLREEMALLARRDTYEVDPDDAWERLKIRYSKPIEMVVARHVAAWREREARARNVPRSRVLKDDALAEVVMQQPKDADALARLRAIPKGWERSSSASGLVAAVQAALATPREDWPKIIRHKPQNEATTAAGEVLRVLLKLVSEETGVAARMIAGGEDLAKIAEQGEAADVPALHGWRRELFGEAALKLVSGRSALRFSGRKLEVFEIG
ncbi:MAG: ribonuclease D [Rhizobiaceae bacterium]|nr:ribonuclease D [Rhizobiaceae bacterium]